MNTLKGVIPVLPTPFSQDGKTIEYDVFAGLVELVIKEGANAVALFGAGGEFYKLSPEEKRELLGIASRICHNRLPLIATVTAHATRYAVFEAEEMQKGGADVINILPPSFAFPTNDMITTHVIRVAEAVSVPIMVQYAPALTGGVISNETFARIKDRTRNELYIKVEANPTGPAVSSIMEATGGQYGLIVGNAGECMYEALVRGACAVMPGMAVLRPYCEIYRAFVSGDADRAFDLFNDFLPYIHFIQRTIEQFVAMEKIVLVERGILKNGHCRQPSSYPDETTKKLLLKYYHVIEKKFGL